LRIGHLGLAPLLYELLFELLLLRGRCLADLSELLLNFSDPPLRRFSVLQQVDLALRTIC
jgi:hypothetical protein